MISERRHSMSDNKNNEVGRDIINLYPGPQDVDEIIDDTTKIIVNLEDESGWDYWLGKMVSGIFSIGTGVTAAAMLSTLGLSTPLFLTLAGVLFLGSAYRNYRMTNRDVSTLFAGGVKGLFLKKKIVDTEAKIDISDQKTEYLSYPKMFMLGCGIVLSAAFGSVIGALTFVSTLNLAVAFPVLASVAVGLTPIGIILGSLTFICLSCLMIKAFSEIIKDDVVKNIKDTWNDIFGRQTEGRDKGKSDARFYLERTIVGITAALLVAVPLTLIFWGVTNTLMNSAVAFGQILNTVTALPLATINLISNVIACGFGLAAQVPFILRTSLTPILKLFTSKKTSEDAKPTSTREKISNGVLLVAATICAIADGVVALSGKPIGIYSILAGIGAGLNSFFAGVVNATLNKRVPAAAIPADATVEKDIRRSSNSHISRGLSIRPDLQHDANPTLPDQDRLAAVKSHPTPLFRRRQSSSAAANEAKLERQSSFGLSAGH
jgi:hypothetical protein